MAKHRENIMDIKKELPGAKENTLLREYTTFKIGGRARYFFMAKEKEELIKALKVAKKYKLPLFILGAGSNVLISGQWLRGLVIKIQDKKYKINGQRIFAEAGLPLAVLVKESIKRGLSGFEWAAGIPGTVGGATRGNAGAFGKSMKDIIEAVEFFNLNNFKISKIKNKKCKFNYRESIFKEKNNFIILSVYLELKKSSKKIVKEKVRRFLAYRQNRHPRQPSAGSIFKGVGVKELGKIFFKKFPETKKVFIKKGIPAAFLIAQCKLEGKKIGKAQISEKHPNFIINLGGAKAGDVKKLINLTKKKVKNKFGILLEEEIQYL